jgi:hypothetical protein
VAALRSWPTSIDHGDLHARNFGVRSTGEPFVLDWADAARSLPFVSIEFLCRVAANTIGPRAAAAVNQAYLAALPWGQLREREEALWMARGCAPLNFADAMLAREQDAGMPRGTLAWIMARCGNQLLRYYETGRTELSAAAR